MAYIPPHRRHINDLDRPLPTPDLLLPQFQRNLNLRYPGSTLERKDENALKIGNVPDALHTIYRWWMVGLTDDDQFPASVRLEKTVSLEFCDGGIPLHVVGGLSPREVNKTTRSSGRSPWVSIAEKILPDLITSSQNVRNGIDFQESEDRKPCFVARFGKCIFDKDASFVLDTIKQTSAVETALSSLKRSFYTNIPRSYMESILSGIVPMIGFDIDEEKEYYLLKVSDKSWPDIILTCKCNVVEIEGKLVLHKIGITLGRNLVIDMSCLDKNLDLRLMLFTKRMLKAITDDEMHGFRNLISSAIIDPDVRGGLRWPLGKQSFGDRFRVVSVWHYKTKDFKNSSIRLKLRDADRFYFESSTGEVTKEVFLKMTGINTQLRDQTLEIDAITKMLQDTLKMIWDHFLSCDHSFP